MDADVIFVSLSEKHSSAYHYKPVFRMYLYSFKTGRSFPSNCIGLQWSWMELVAVDGFGHGSELTMSCWHAISNEVLHTGLLSW